MMPVRSLLQLLRPQQWLKNVFVFAPVFFAGQMGDRGKVAATALAAVAFCLMASAIYVLNDLLDAVNDRLHPQKKLRPIAARKVSMAQAGVLGVTCSAGGIYMASLCAWPTLGIGVAYMAINVAYCLRLKHTAIADLFSIATGFVLRVLAGGAATGIATSQWLVIMTFLLSLFLALGKRRDDLTIAAASGIAVRPVLRGYTIPFVDVCMGLLTAVLVMSYILYCLSPDVIQRRNGEWVYLSAILVLAGMFRYLQITIVKHGSFSPTRVLCHDRFIQAVVAVWTLFFFAVLYF